ncbi:hypothetical protein PSYPI_43070, partial [Pseudomonas syringae pv. pisi str. 1704B]
AQNTASVSVLASPSSMLHTPSAGISTHPIGQKTKIPDHPEMLFRDVLHHPAQHVGLAQRFLLIGLCAVIQVGKAQRGPA